MAFLCRTRPWYVLDLSTSNGVETDLIPPALSRFCRGDRWGRPACSNISSFQSVSTSDAYKLLIATLRSAFRSFLTSKMEVYITFLASTATLQVTTGFPMNLLPPITAQSKAAELRKRYDLVEQQHRHFVEKILPRMPSNQVALNPDLQGVVRTTVLLER